MRTRTRKILAIILFIVILSISFTSIAATQSEYVEITTHTTMTRSQLDIKKKFDESQPVNISSNFYETTPVLTQPYNEGSISTQTRTDMLNQINYFRWLSGLNNVTIAEQYMEYAQKGALIQAINRGLSHFPTRPEGMSDDMYNKGYKASNGGVLTDWNTYQSYSADISYGTYAAQSIKAYVDDTNNLEPNVGHRLSILDRYAKDVAFGYVNTFTCIDVLSSIYTQSQDKFHAWPVAGNMPVEAINLNARWSITLGTWSPDYTLLKDGNVILKCDEKTYSSANGDFTLNFIDSYNSCFFDLPTELKNNLKNTSSTIKSGKTVEVEAYIAQDKSGNNVVIKYPINFFSLNNVVTKIALPETESLAIGGEKTLTITVEPTSATPDNTIKWESSNPAVATVDQNGKITAISKGTATITAKLGDLSATTAITVTDYLKGDVDLSGEVKVADAIITLKGITGKTILTDKQKEIADVNNNNRLDIGDAIKILKYVTKKITTLD